MPPRVWWWTLSRATAGGAHEHTLGSRVADRTRTGERAYLPCSPHSHCWAATSTIYARGSLNHEWGQMGEGARPGSRQPCTKPLLIPVCAATGGLFCPPPFRARSCSFCRAHAARPRPHFPFDFFLLCSGSMKVYTCILTGECHLCRPQHANSDTPLWPHVVTPSTPSPSTSLRPPVLAVHVDACHPPAGTEFYSDAKDIHTEVAGMVWVEAVNATEGGACFVFCASNGQPLPTPLASPPQDRHPASNPIASHTVSYSGLFHFTCFLACRPPHPCCCSGKAVDVGGGTEFGGAEDDEGCDDAAETKLDQFWQFSDIEVCALPPSHFPPLPPPLLPPCSLLPPPPLPPPPPPLGGFLIQVIV
jgi:hypothetical protein